MYPNVYKQFVDETGLKEPTAQFIIDNHKTVKDDQSINQQGSSDVYPQKWRNSE